MNYKEIGKTLFVYLIHVIPLSHSLFHFSPPVENARLGVKKTETLSPSFSVHQSHQILFDS